MIEITLGSRSLTAQGAGDIISERRQRQTNHTIAGRNSLARKYAALVRVPPLHPIVAISQSSQFHYGSIDWLWHNAGVSEGPLIDPLV